ncbi:MAG: hypothetical protein ACE5FA_12880 [Dehalococcoidia bacterium]
MAWTFGQTPAATPGAEVCITVSGGTGTPSVLIETSEGVQIKPSSIKSKGGGSYVICFIMPIKDDAPLIQVSGGGCATPSTLIL